MCNDREKKVEMENTISILKNMLALPSDGISTGELNKAIEVAITEVGKAIPKRVVEKQWIPNKCPTCNAYMGGKADDGYYDNPHLKFCPECRQLLDWGDDGYW